jgi:DNA-binding response OmpR family regulator
MDDSRKKILLIEDELSINDLYKRVLEHAGFEVIVAFDGIQGLALAQNKPDVILLDIMLPKMNGIEVLKQIKLLEGTKRIPVVLISNLGQTEVIEKAYQLGAQGYILKMRINPGQLVEFVNLFLKDPNYIMPFDSLILD